MISFSKFILENSSFQDGWYEGRFKQVENIGRILYFYKESEICEWWIPKSSIDLHLMQTYGLCVCIRSIKDRTLNGPRNRLTLFLLGGQFDPPVFFLHNLKSIGLRLLKFSDFSYIPKALSLGLKPGFDTNCLSSQAHCLNAFSCSKLNLCFDPLPLVRFW